MSERVNEYIKLKLKKDQLLRDIRTVSAEIRRQSKIMNLYVNEYDLTAERARMLWSELTPAEQAELRKKVYLDA